jgi:hypothetical protein
MMSWHPDNIMDLHNLLFSLDSYGFDYTSRQGDIFYIESHLASFVCNYLSVLTDSPILNAQNAIILVTDNLGRNKNLQIAERMRIHSLIDYCSIL